MGFGGAGGAAGVGVASPAVADAGAGGLACVLDWVAAGFRQDKVPAQATAAMKHEIVRVTY